MTKEKEKAYNDAWYEANKKDYNASRRKKYAENKKLREKCKKRSRDYHRNKKKDVEMIQRPDYIEDFR